MTEFILGFVFVMYVVTAVLIYVSKEEFCEIFPEVWERVLVFASSPVLLPVAVIFGVFKKYIK